LKERRKKRKIKKKKKKKLKDGGKEDIIYHRISGHNLPKGRSRSFSAPCRLKYWQKLNLENIFEIEEN